MTHVPTNEILPDHCVKDVVVLCCGNVLYGDDGFGPAVAERIDRDFAIPDWAVVIDAGTGVRALLLDMVLGERRPRSVVVVDAVDLRVDAVDAVDLGRRPGEVFGIPLDQIPPARVSEFSLHQAPTSSVLQELQAVGGVRVTVIACQVGSVPEEMTEEMSPAVAAAIDRAATMIVERFLCDPASARSP